MIKETVSLDEVVEVLNRMVKADPLATQDLVNSRVECNEVLVKDPTIQVVRRDTPRERCVVGILGVLNGLFGVHDDGYGAIQVTYGDDGSIMEFGLTRQANEALGRNERVG